MNFDARRKFLCGCLSVMLFCLTACKRDLLLGGYTLAEPAKADLIGVWKLDEASLRELRERGGYDLTAKQPRLHLLADSQIEIHDLPDWVLNDEGKAHGAFHSYEGLWQLEKGGGYWQVTTVLSDMSLSWLLRNAQPPYQLRMILGNSDAGRAMVFVRQP
jgi:hypothetical protein